MMKMKAPAAIKMYASCSMTVGSVNSCKKLGCYWWCHINASSIKRKLLKEESGKRKSRNQTLVWHITWSLQRYNTTRLQWCIFQNLCPKYSHHLFCNKFIPFYTKSMYMLVNYVQCVKRLDKKYRTMKSFFVWELDTWSAFLDLRYL